MPAGLACTRFADQIARNSKMPDFRVIETMIIMPDQQADGVEIDAGDGLLLGQEAEP